MEHMKTPEKRDILRLKAITNEVYDARYLGRPKAKPMLYYVLLASRRFRVTFFVAESGEPSNGARSNQHLARHRVHSPRRAKARESCEVFR
jgi:hypothetical protein